MVKRKIYSWLLVCALLILALTNGLMVAATVPAGAEEVIVTTKKELTSALNRARPGTVIKLAPGDWSNLEISITKNGTAEQPITLTVTDPGSVFITGASKVVTMGNYIVLDGLYFKDGQPADQNGAIQLKGFNNRATNCSIVNYNNEKAYTKWVSLYNRNHRVDHCYFAGKNNGGALLVVWRSNPSPNHHLIDHNVFRDFADGGGVNEWETIRIGTSDFSQSASYTTVEYNYFENCNGEIEIISNKACHNTIRYNTLINCKGHICLRHGNNCVVEGNVIKTGNLTDAGGIRVMDKEHLIINNYIEGVRTTSNARGGIVIYGSDLKPALNGYWPTEKIRVENNSLIDCQQSLVFGGGNTQAPPVSVSFTNNVIRNNLTGEREYALIREVKKVQEVSFSGDIFYGSFLGLLTLTPPEGIVLSDPQITLGSDGLYYALDPTKGAHPPVVLKESDVGPRTYRP